MTLLFTLVLAFFPTALLSIGCILWIAEKVQKKTVRPLFLMKRQLMWQLA